MALNVAAAFNPVRYARTLRESPRWVGRFIVLAALYVCLGIAGGVDRAELAADRLPPSASAGDRSAAGESLLNGIAIRSLFLPVRLFAGWSIFALVLLYACRIWSTREEVRFVHILASEVYAEGAILAGNAASLAAALLGGTPGDPSAPWVPGGLDLLVFADDFVLRYVLNSFNIFSIAYVATLALTVSVVLGVSRTKAFISVLLAWGSTLFVNAGIFHALRTEFHFGL
ncbi:MAG TPA: hypothetical protein VI932_03385 [Bacteroidota bacterium]|nr:hypothetical protein [Bacteroidota bacterium]